jgi:hypothetical protein
MIAVATGATFRSSNSANAAKSGVFDPTRPRRGEPTLRRKNPVHLPQRERPVKN